MSSMARVRGEAGEQTWHYSQIRTFDQECKWRRIVRSAPRETLKDSVWAFQFRQESNIKPREVDEARKGRSVPFK